MNKFLAPVFVAAALSLTANNVLADEPVRETRSVTANVTKVKLGGVVDLVLRQGATPSLVVSGDREFVSLVTTEQRGNTLEIGTRPHDRRSINRERKVRAELTVPNLQDFVSHGVGSSTLTGFTGDSLQLALDGAGAVNVNSRYRHVDARLGGAGSLTLDANQAEEVELNLRGAGRMTATGQSKLLRARLSGVGSLDAQGLRADTVELDLTGLGSASVYAKDSAKVNLSGMGSATVYGNPANRNANANGMGKVSWK
jgi:hypothetical protein